MKTYLSLQLSETRLKKNKSQQLSNHLRVIGIAVLMQVSYKIFNLLGHKRASQLKIPPTECFLTG